MASIGLKTGSLLSFVAILTAYLYSRQYGDDLKKQHLDSVLSGLLRAEKKVHVLKENRVAVGFGSCLDIFVNAVDVMDKVGASADTEPEHFAEMTNMTELEKMFAYFFRHGAAAERYTPNQTLFDLFVNISKSLPEADLRLGGNAPVMASRFKNEGWEVLLGAQMSAWLRTLLPKGIKVSGSVQEDDDIHLIMEYKTGAVWGEHVSPRANRFIVHSDANNPGLSSMEDFSEELAQFDASLLVIGGLQMMDNFPFLPDQRHERLSKLSELLFSVPDTTLIHFEMASFSEEQCLQDVIDNVVYYADSLGMNEQELPNLHSLLTGGSITLISDPYPRIATTLDQMRTVFGLLSGPRGPLTRLHVHTLAYQAIMTTRDSPWKNSMSAAAKAALTANRHTCGSSYISTDKAKLLMDDSFTTALGEDGVRKVFNSSHPVNCWNEDHIHICLAPVLVCTEVVQTAGGGDNISSAGLVLQI